MDILKESSKSLKNLNLITVITFSYERPDLLYRSLSFWNQFKVKHLIFDGSKFPNPYIEKFNGLENLKYFHKPVSYKQRFSLISNYLKTPYFILIADDDLCFPSVISKSIEFLEKNPDYAACCGRALGFGINNLKKIYPVFPVYEEMYFDYNINENDPFERINSHLSCYTPSTMYAIQRSCNWEFIVGHFLENDFSIFSIIELEMEILTAFKGKSKVFKDLGWLKSTEEEQISTNEPTFNREIHLDMLWNDNSFDEEIKLKYLFSLSSYIAKRTQIDEKLISEKLSSTFKNYSNWYKNYIKTNIPLFKFRERVKKLIPKLIKEKILHFYRKIKYILSINSRYKNFHNFLKRLNELGWQVNINEAILIENHIRKYHEYTLKK